MWSKVPRASPPLVLPSRASDMLMGCWWADSMSQDLGVALSVSTLERLGSSHWTKNWQKKIYYLPLIAFRVSMGILSILALAEACCYFQRFWKELRKPFTFIPKLNCIYVDWPLTPHTLTEILLRNQQDSALASVWLQIKSQGINSFLTLFSADSPVSLISCNCS